eukprot:snap_masked-scaffold1635_size32709-processed-gene-0.2 protein:Tk07222 transcript:snap_masked-scaffold1635_size32709-processed-gene-0.2-mRNA-1 annotation:"dna-binding protein ets97d"
MSDQDFITTDEDDYLDVDDTTLGEEIVGHEDIQQSFIGSGGFELPFASEDGIVSHLIDIREPLYNLKRALAKRLQLSLDEHHFWLQDAQQLPEDTTLVEQCVQGEGLVQINVEIKTEADTQFKKINIVDVLKPSDEVIAEATSRGPAPLSPLTLPWGSPPAQLAMPIVDDLEADDSTSQESNEPLIAPAEDAGVGGSGPYTRWVVCSAFRKEQERLNIPTDPMEWERAHVAHWIKWAIREFPNASIDSDDWHMDGRELCGLSQAEFRRKVPLDPTDMMWTHVELLRKCKFVAVIQTQTEASRPKPSLASPRPSAYSLAHPSVAQIPRKTHKKPPVRLGTAKFTVMSESALGNRTGNNGQVQLWQFLLELLTEKDHREAIHWIGNDGEFKLENPEIVAQLWGTRKNKPSMNYEKLSRALRYYYDGDMISKVQGKRFVYKFVCDLKQLIGYSAAELNRLVTEAEQRSTGQSHRFR